MVQIWLCIDVHGDFEFGTMMNVGILQRTVSCDGYFLICRVASLTYPVLAVDPFCMTVSANLVLP